MKIFFESDLRHYLDNRRAQLVEEVRAQSLSYLQGTVAKEYISYLVDKYSVAPLQLKFDEASASSREEAIPAEDFPNGFMVFAGKSYKKPVITFHIPFEGEKALLYTRPSTHIVWSHQMELSESEIAFELVDFSGEAEKTKSLKDEVFRSLKVQADHVNVDVRGFNDGLAKFAAEAFSGRVGQLEKQDGVLKALGVRIRKSSDVPASFVVPAKRRAVLPPTFAPKSNSPVPVISSEVYAAILQAIFDLGKVFERLPNTHLDKDEQSLRDHFILHLEPHFEGSTTGETFNRAGKTDILIRHEKTNVFVAECKFWGGSAQHGKTIDQLLSYLTWRDSKTAIIYFVDNASMSSVLDAILESTPKHHCS